LTDLSDLSPQDQAILQHAPTAVAMAAALAERDGPLDLIKEMKAGLQAALDAASAFPENQIIRVLAVAMQEVDEDTINPSEPESEAREADVPLPDRARVAALEQAANSMAIMQEQATIEEAIQFKHWLYAIADQVTIAAKSGGFLGFGSVQVSDKERQFLADLRAALGLEEASE
jgi:hypothetical protein